MLLGLRLKNIALIESLELGFNSGFSVFTGETGAGKSVFLFALDSLLGGEITKFGSRLIRAGTSEALIEGSFSLDYFIKDWLNSNSFEVSGEELYISRDWKLREGRLSSRIRLNGEIINKKQILSLRAKLIDFAQQGGAYHLHSSLEQLKLIDRFGKNYIEKALILVKQNWRTWRVTKSELEMARSTSEKDQIKVLKLQTLIDDLNNANIDDPLEEQYLKEEQDRLVHGVKLQETLSFLFSTLKDSSDEFPSASDHILSSIQQLRSAVKLDSGLQFPLNSLVDSYKKLEDVLALLEEYQLLLESDPNKLDQIQNRISEINRIKSRYDCNLDDLIIKKNQACQQIESVPQNHIQKLENEEILARQELEKNSFALSQLRRQYAQKLEANLIKQLKPLGLDHIQFKIDFSSSDLSEFGGDRVDFLFSANKGQPMAPLAQVASGGEMSRFLLALTTVFADVLGTKTLIFDEIDSGVSGSISLAIAKLLKDLSLKKQVFCITHQPVVAAFGDHHYSVLKTVENDVTSSKVLLLKGFEERQAELAKLTGGDFMEARAYAAGLLNNKAA